MGYGLLGYIVYILHIIINLFLILCVYIYIYMCVYIHLILWLVTYYLGNGALGNQSPETLYSKSQEPCGMTPNTRGFEFRGSRSLGLRGLWVKSLGCRVNGA